MIFALACIGAMLIILFFRRAVLLMPAWMMLTPKALLLVDIPGIPVLSVYRFLMAIVLVMYGITLALARRGALTRGPFFAGLVIFFGTAGVSVIMNLGSATAGVMTWIALLLEVGVPVMAFAHFAGGMRLDEARALLRVYVVFFTLLAMYAIAAYLVNWNPYIDFINSTTQTGRVMARTYADTLRGMRAQGTTSHPITYGALVAMLLLCYYVVKLCARIRPRQLIALGLFSGVIVTSVLLTNSRSPLILYFFALLVFGVSVGIIKSLKYSLLGAVLFVAALASSDVFLEKVLSVVNIFDSSIGVEQNGSDLAMRAGQFAVSLSYFWQSPLWGLGLDATRELVAGGSASDLYDAESVVFTLMINQGVLGFVGFIVLLWMVHRGVCRVLPTLKARRMFLGLVLGYALFTVATGVMDTLQMFLLMSIFVGAYGRLVAVSSVARPGQQSASLLDEIEHGSQCAGEAKDGRK
ncbi:O-antigen ligase family protein [Stenotrophomonas cyclobalanopsidis]|uniref:O-antigen ligase family protein n=1 Tax=Stenotrophomonas cyclobalanopsidis TaxID=2771362 RepID=A0ABQ6T1N4_9GAMM|nr:O-antigen ligase family protein [Stenotrophomonas cyclobalanopsidis]KAA8999575.1 O-antigen ligase family protein [Stenotrophomonas cyclobalanopsidis]